MAEKALTEEEMASKTAIRRAKQTLRKLMHQKISQVSGSEISEQCLCSLTYGMK